MQTSRLFEIIYTLLDKENKKSVTAGELAQKFGVSTRTIYRDIDVLSLAGIPVYTEKGKGGGISLLPDFVLNKSILSEQEQNEILVALHGLSNIKTAETGQVLRKLSTIFNKTAVNWLEVDFSDWSYTNDFFNDFKTAILERRIAQFDYYNNHGKKTFKRIEPVQLWFKSRSWYIKGFCLEKQSMRLYRMSRVKNLVVTSEHFLERDLLAETDSTDHNRRRDKIVALKLRVYPEMAYRVFDEFDESTVEKQPDDSFIINVIWIEDNWLYGFVLSFGEYIEVLEPEHLRKTIKEKAKKILERHL